MYSDETTYQTYLADWMQGKRYSLSPKTLKDHESCIRNHIVPMIGDLKLSQLTPMILQNFVNALKDKGLANASVKRIFTVVRSSLDAAEKMHLIPRNYAAVDHKPKVTRKQLQVWNSHQVRHFLVLASRDPYTNIAFHLALMTGMRQGEILGLRWTDVDLDGELIYVTQTLGHIGKMFLPGAKTSSGIRPIALDPESVNILRKHHQRAQDNKEQYPEKYNDLALVVSTKFGNKTFPQDLMRVWYRLLAESGLPKITFHDLRHTHASLLLKNNVHPKIVSERLGRSSIRITLDTYSHLLPNMQKDAAEKLGEVILGNNENH